MTIALHRDQPGISIANINGLICYKPPFPRLSKQPSKYHLTRFISLKAESTASFFFSEQYCHLLTYVHVELIFFWRDEFLVKFLTLFDHFIPAFSNVAISLCHGGNSLEIVCRMFLKFFSLMVAQSHSRFPFPFLWLCLLLISLFTFAVSV